MAAPGTLMHVLEVAAKLKAAAAAHAAALEAAAVPAVPDGTQGAAPPPRG